MATITNGAAVTASNATEEKNEDDRRPPSPPPAMLPHRREEFDFAERTLRRMVADSSFFPEAAGGADWFQPPARDDDAPVVDIKRDADASAEDDSSLDPLAPAEEAATVSPREKRSAVPSIREEDVDYGEVLGVGGFCEVRLAGLGKEGGTKPADASGLYQHHRYAMKYLSPTKTAPNEDPNIIVNKYGNSGKPTRNKQFERGVADLAIEARFLSLLSHANIIRLHYVGRGDLSSQFNCASVGEEEEEDAGGKEGDSNRHKFGYFLLLDPLYETLAKRIEGTYLPESFGGDAGEFPAAPPPSSSSSRAPGARRNWWRRMIHKNPEDYGLPLAAWRVQLAARLEGLAGIASALRHLHEDCRIVYRDVKPDNIGFYRKPHPRCHCGEGGSPEKTDDGGGSCTCYAEIPKLFDFGLAKELKPKYLRAHPRHVRDAGAGGKGVDTYKLTARSGSRRYMAPEVALSAPYNEKSDVYSFGVVLYHAASLVVPFEGYSLFRHEDEVLRGRDRPDLRIPRGRRDLARVRRSCGVPHAEWLAKHEGGEPKKRNKIQALRSKCVWTKDLARLIEECWADDMRERPGMGDVASRLGGCIRELTGGGSAREKGTKKATIAVGQETERLSCGEAESFDHLVGTPQ